MKRIVTIGLALVILLHSSTKLAIVIYFQLNKDFISSVLCENKAKPEINCNGKCYLDKKIKAEEKRERKNTPVFKGFEAIHLICSEIQVFHSCINIFSILSSSSLYIIKHYQSPISSILQPPK